MVLERAIACGLAWLLPMAAAMAVDWPSVPVPDDAKGEIVSDHMVYNGIDMHASRFATHASMADMKAFYRKEWGSRMVETPSHGKTVLGHMSGRYYITVELTPSGASTRGQIGITRIPDDKPDPASLGKGFSRPPMTRVYEDIVYMDTPEKTRTLRFGNNLSPFQNAQFYARMLRGKGFQPSQSPASTCASTSSKCVSSYEKGEERIVIAYVGYSKGTQMAAVIQ